MKKILYWVILVAIILVVGNLVLGNNNKKASQPTNTSNINNREVVDNNVLQDKKVLYALVFGQSNSGNYGDGKYTCQEPVYNWHDGKLYKAADPLLGTDGGGGSVWSRLGDKLIEQGLYDAVVFVPIGVGATAISEWSPGGKHHPALLKAIRDNPKINCIMWHQGESDTLAGTSEEEYYDKLQQLIQSIRNEGNNSPFYVSVATFHTGKTSIPIQNAQREIVDPSKNILQGPNTDNLIGDKYRRIEDYVHFTSEGLNNFANLWVNVLIN